MVRIRLKRVGGKKHPFYRVVVADQRAARDGAFIEQIGTYDPFPDPPEIKLDEEKVQKWLKNGAQPSDSVTDLLRSTGVFPKLNTVAPVEEAPKAAAKPAKKAPSATTAVDEAPAPVEAEDETPAEESAPEESAVEEAPAEEEKPAAEEAKEDSTSG
ncbi:MAG: 30S ribosomal protein S16 [Chloroflexi bacterium]|nr:30S ribosomal protein S16 [Chloroflexota bacterium]